MLQLSGCSEGCCYCLNCYCYWLLGCRWLLFQTKAAHSSPPNTVYANWWSYKGMTLSTGLLNTCTCKAITSKKKKKNILWISDSIKFVPGRHVQMLTRIKLFHYREKDTNRTLRKPNSSAFGTLQYFENILVVGTLQNSSFPNLKSEDAMIPVSKCCCYSNIARAGKEAYPAVIHLSVASTNRSAPPSPPP